MNRSSFTHRGLEISYLDSDPGDAARPAVLLLHGFPDEAAMWRVQIDALHCAGYRAIAPDMCGYGCSGMAELQEDYDYESILADHLALLDHLGISCVHVVGHDWGAIMAWFLSAHHRSRVRSLAALSVGHPTCYAHGGLRQKIKGWYVAYFLIKGWSERRLMGGGRLGLRRLLVSHPRIDDAMARLREPGRLTAALRIYRANAFALMTRRHPNVAVPTLALWSAGDAFLDERQAIASRARVDGPWRYERLPGGHWIPLEQPDRLETLLLQHLAAACGRSG